MLSFVLYLAGSFILLGASIAAFNSQPNRINVAYIIASILFIAGGTAGLVSLL